jgi:4-amino-4-deoxy-L-arabinose transferase-like glycosyltransferase
MQYDIDRTLQRWFTTCEKIPKIAWGLTLLWLLPFCGIAFLWHLGSIGLVDETEPLFAEAARQMTVTGDWVTPYFNGETRFDKPPLIYWFMAICYHLLGVNEWAVRLPSALAAIALTGMGFYVLRRFGFPNPSQGNPAAQADLPASDSTTQRWLAAFIGSAIMALNFQTIIWARTGVSDMLLSGCLGSALLAFFCGYAQPEKRSTQTAWYMAFYVLLSGAVLTKGPVGIVLPGLIIGLFLLYVGNFGSVVREMRLIPGILVFLLLTVPWYVLVILANGEDYIDSFFGYHNFERFTRVVNGHDGVWYFYIPVTLGCFFPWSIHLPMAIARLRFWRRNRWHEQPRATHLGMFALCWFIGIFGFFTIAVTKLPSYVLPLIPAASILVALLWSDQMTRQRPLGQGMQWTMRISTWLSLFLSLAFAIALFYSPNWVDKIESGVANLGDLLRHSHFWVWGIATWAGLAIASIVLILRRQTRWIWAAQTIGMLLFVTTTILPLSITIDHYRQLPLRELAATIAQEHQSQEAIVMVGFKKPSLVFYTQQPVLFWPDEETTIQQLDRLHRKQRDLETVILVGTPSKIRQTNIPSSLYTEIELAGNYQAVRVTLPLPKALSQEGDRPI